MAPDLFVNRYLRDWLDLNVSLTLNKKESCRRFDSETNICNKLKQQILSPSKPSDAPLFTKNNDTKNHDTTWAHLLRGIC